METENTTEEGTGVYYPPKPVIEERNQNSVIRSLLSLGIYAFMFFVLLNGNLANVAAILVVIIIHEMGHFSLMKLFKYSNVKMFIVPLLGAFTSGKKSEMSQWQLVLIILAGPVPGIIAGCAIYWFNHDLHDPTLKMLANTFLLINLFNCLPFYPLDGGRLLETLFFKEHFVIRLVFSAISVIALAVIAIVLKSPFLLIIPVFIGLDIVNENKFNKIREYLRAEGIAYKSEYSALADRSYWLIRDCIIFSFPKRYGMIPAGKYEYTILEPMIVQQVSAVLQIPLIADMNILKRVLALLFFIAVCVGSFMFVAWYHPALHLILYRSPA